MEALEHCLLQTMKVADAVNAWSHFSQTKVMTYILYIKL